jgi:hypothetical protein
MGMVGMMKKTEGVRATPAIHYNRDDMQALQEGARGVVRDA